MTRHDDVPAAGSTASGRAIPWWAALLIGVGAALAGLLPWVITGMRLPLQNLWASATPPGGMPIALLPFSQYAITLIVGLLVVGPAIGGLVVRLLRERMPRPRTALVLVGIVAVQFTAIVQTASVVVAGLQRRSESGFYVVALTLVAVLAAGFGILTFFLIAKAPRAGAVAGLSIAALALGPWLSALIVPFGTVASNEVYAFLGWLRWIPPVLVGLAIAWGGIDTVGRVVAGLFGLLLVWIVPAIQTGIFNAAGSRVLANDLGEMREYGLAVFVAALTRPEIAIPPLAVAILVAAIGLVVRAVGARGRTTGAPAATARDSA